MIPRDEGDILQACEDIGAAIAKGKAAAKAKEVSIFVEKEKQKRAEMKKQCKPVEKIVYVEKENTKEEDRLKEENASLKVSLKMQKEATLRLETKISEKDIEIKKLHEARDKVEIELTQYKIDRGQLQVYKLMFDKDNGVKETRSALSISRTP